MTTIKSNPRKYSCKNEELPVIGGYVLTSIKRDSEKFEAYSPAYNAEGIDAFEKEIDDVDMLVNPKSEMNERKLITGILYEGMDAVIEKSKHVEGYIIMSRGTVPISVKDFGITALKQRAKARDAEGMLQNIKFVIANLIKYKCELMAQGFTEELLKFFMDAATSISQLNRKQYEMTTERKATVQENINMMNALYDHITEICKIGKILFSNNPEKMKEYTFSKLKKRVSSIAKSDKNDENSENDHTYQEENIK